MHIIHAVINTIIEPLREGGGEGFKLTPLHQRVHGRYPAAAQRNESVYAGSRNGCIETRDCCTLARNVARYKRGARAFYNPHSTYSMRHRRNMCVYMCTLVMVYSIANDRYSLWPKPDTTIRSARISSDIYTWLLPAPPLCTYLVIWR